MSKIFQKFHKFSQKTLLIIISILLILLVLSGTLVYSYFNPNKSKLGSQNNSIQNSINSSPVSQNQISKTVDNSNLSEKVQLETAILEECDLVIKYNPAKYYVVQSENIYKVGTKLEIRQKNLASGNDSLLLYQCNSDNYSFGNVSGELQKLYPSTGFKIPLFDNSFWDKTVEAGVIAFPGNVALRNKEEFPLDWLKVKDNPNFQAGIKTIDSRTIFHQMTFRNDPIFWNGENLQFGLKNKESKQTKSILSVQEYQRLADEENTLDAKKVKKFQNWEKIKFDGKINKISDIPENLLDKYGIPQFGFRFYKGVVFWTGYRTQQQDLRLSLTKFQESQSLNNDLDKQKINEISNEGVIAYDGTNIVEIKDELGKEIKNHSGYSIYTYYISTLIKDGIGYNFGQACGGWGCTITPGFFIDFNKGQYWTNKDGTNAQNDKLKDQKAVQPYLDYDFKVWNGSSPKIISDTGYKTYKDGKIYGKFQKYTNSLKDERPVSEGDFLVESDGQNYKFVVKMLKEDACSNIMGLCANNIILNMRGNVVYYRDYEMENEIPKENSTENPTKDSKNSKDNLKDNKKMKFTEQDLKTGKILQEEISPKNAEILKKYGIIK